MSAFDPSYVDLGFSLFIWFNIKQAHLDQVPNQKKKPTSDDDELVCEMSNKEVIMPSNLLV